MPKYIFITGGVVSSLGKGIASASIGKLLESRGLKVTLIKCDPYINVDPGTMNPYQHGEVYVTADGAETDLDLGHYERFTNAALGKDNNITTGKIYYSVISRERRGDYLGKTVQIIPHITDEIKNSIKKVAVEQRVDAVIVEIGGTVGDIEGLPFLEAIRQMRLETGSGYAINVHVTLVPFIKSAGEIKTKPTQHSVQTLREIGIIPDIMLCRTERQLSKETREKIALFCSVDKEAVISAIDAKSIYEVPVLLQREGLDALIVRLLNLKCQDGDLSDWENNVLKKIKCPAKEVEIAVVGKYITLQDAYKSIYESLTHGGIANAAKLAIRRVDSEDIEKDGPARYLDGVRGILVPGGFGFRGIEGKIRAAQFARENQIPFFGICLGMQTAVIEFARNVCGLKNANSTEFNPNTKYPVIGLMEGQKKIDAKGATMRLGSYECALAKGGLSRSAYGKDLVSERHRHRYEFNNDYRGILEKKGMFFSGIYRKGNLVEIIELKGHPWFVACQFHPEFRSKPDKCHPLFREFIRAAISTS
ncbi:MAG: CTP synthase [Candidatus Omnitrophica bacterium]|nr:CTP synthase [Candidatus Omnitrophota bacterium]